MSHTHLDAVTEAIRRQLPAFNHNVHGSYAAYMAKAALDALRDPRFAQGEQVTVNRALLRRAMTVPPYVLDSAEGELWVLMHRPRDWSGTGFVSTADIMALRRAAAMNE